MAHFILLKVPSVCVGVAGVWPVVGFGARTELLVFVQGKLHLKAKFVSLSSWGDIRPNLERSVFAWLACELWIPFSPANS